MDRSALNRTWKSGVVAVVVVQGKLKKGVAVQTQRPKKCYNDAVALSNPAPYILAPAKNLRSTVSVSHDSFVDFVIHFSRNCAVITSRALAEKSGRAVVELPIVDVGKLD